MNLGSAPSSSFRSSPYFSRLGMKCLSTVVRTLSQVSSWIFPSDMPRKNRSEL